MSWQTPCPCSGFSPSEQWASFTISKKASLHHQSLKAYPSQHKYGTTEGLSLYCLHLHRYQTRWGEKVDTHISAKQQVQQCHRTCQWLSFHWDLHIVLKCQLHGLPSFSHGLSHGVFDKEDLVIYRFNIRHPNPTFIYVYLTASRIIVEWIELYIESGHICLS